ncbi:MAG: uroporphyrinogen-III synthase [Bdellovibrionaceae bacterium]|nr:uroporphyrinogen-III synthase [Pseudobdellovibrionaceae bacterium]
MSEPLNILVTGDETLRSRLPSRAGEHALEWTILPVLEFERLPVPESIFDSLSGYDWLIFTSPRAVQFWTEALLEAGTEVGPETRIACMGPRTAEVASNDGYTPDLVPEKPGTEGFIEAFGPLDLEEKKILIPQAEKGRGEIESPLRAAGAVVTTVPLYRTRPRKPIPWVARTPLDSMDLLIFTSPSSVRAVVSQFEVDRGRPVACLGDYTAVALRAEGFKEPHCLRGAKFESIKDWIGERSC